MLFRINMYRLGRERRLNVQRRLHRVAAVAVILAVNAVVAGLLIVAIVLTGAGVQAKKHRLDAAERALTIVLEGRGGPLFSEEELELIRTRAAQVRWSVVLRNVARLTPHDVWLPHVRFTKAFMGIGAARSEVLGLRLSGRLTAGREEEGLSKVMAYVSALGSDPYIGRRFAEPRLVDSAWLKDGGKDYLEFDIFCPVLDQTAPGATPRAAGTLSGGDVTEPAETDAPGSGVGDSAGTGASGENAS